MKTVLKHFRSFALILLIQTNVHASEFLGFPENFKWCVSTSAHQIEGGNTNSDWWAWEQIPGKIRNGDKSGAADDHWNRVDEDIGLMRDLHVGAYRFSVEWAKIEPSAGQFDENAIAHYRHEVQALLANGIEPMITLLHFTLPMWVANQGGLEWQGLPDAFTQFAEVVYTRIAPEVTTWITINEPLVLVSGAYETGTFPPGERRGLADLQGPLYNLLFAHSQTYHRLHELADAAHQTIRVGVAHHLRTFRPYSNGIIDRLASAIAWYIWNWSMVDAVEYGHLRMQVPFIMNIDFSIPSLDRTQDFIGVNYYTGDLIHFSFSDGFERYTDPALSKTDMGWDIYPQGLYQILMALAHRYRGKPILILENGIADHDDSKRPKFIQDHLKSVYQAIKDGAHVESYCHWSLMDNFEWAEGFTPRFGLYNVDYGTFARTPRGSASLFSEIAEKNGFTSELEPR